MELGSGTIVDKDVINMSVVRYIVHLTFRIVQ